MPVVLKDIERKAKDNRDLFLKSGERSYFYSSNTFCNNAREQALYSVRFRDDFFVLVSSLDETVEQNGNYYHLAHHRYSGVVAPQGNKYICSQTNVPECETKYCLGNVAIEKRLYFYEQAPILLIEYTLSESYAPILLHLSPFLAYRWVNSLRHCHNSLFEIVNKPRLLSVSLKNCPDLFIHTSKAFHWNNRSEWYKNFEYVENTQPLSCCYEDLMKAGEMLFTMKQGDSILLALSSYKIENMRALSYFAKRKKTRTKKSEIDYGYLKQ